MILWLTSVDLKFQLQVDHIYSWSLQILYHYLYYLEDTIGSKWNYFKQKYKKLEFHDIYVCNFIIHKISLYIKSYSILSALEVSWAHWIVAGGSLSRWGGSMDYGGHSVVVWHGCFKGGDEKV